MCTQTNETNESRNINVLLGLNTYQGMTDEEIQMVLDYRISQELTSRETLARTTAFLQASEQCIVDNAANAQRALDMLQSIVETEFPTIELVKPRTFTPRSTEV